METKATVAEPASKVWEREFAKGTRNWAYWMRIVYPYVMHIATHPALTEEQKQVAVKEFFRRVAEGMGPFLASVADQAIRFGMTFTVSVPKRAAKPSASPYGGLLV